MSSSTAVLGYLAIACGAKQRQRAAADIALGMAQQRSQRRLPAARLLDLEQTEGVAHFSGIAAGKLRAQGLGRRLFDRRRGGALGIEAMAMNAVVDRAHVLDAQPPGDDQPHRDEDAR